MTALLTINLILLVIAAWLSLTKLVPACATSQYRYRLWRLRDELSGDIRHGKFHDEQAALRVRSLIDIAIEDAADLTALNFALFNVVIRRDQLSDDPLGLAGIDHHDEALIDDRLAGLGSALLAKTLFGSVSGWFITALLIPFVLIAAVRDSGRPRVLRRVADRIRADLLRSNRLEDPHEGIYQHVG